MRTTSLLTGIALLLFGTAASANSEDCHHLIADGGDGVGVVAGKVCVATVVTGLEVTFTASDNWCMTQTHLDVESHPDDFPTTRNGNPIPGRFAYQQTYDSCVTIASYTVPFTTLPVPVYIAAHAVLWDQLSGETLKVVSSNTTPITAVNGNGVTQTAVLANEPINYPNCSDYKSDNAIKSVWDNGIGTDNFTFFNAAGADWIWDAAHPLNPRKGDVVTFEPTFNVPGLVTSSSLRIAADNAFTVDLNGAFVGKSVTLGPDFPATLRETPQGLATPPQVRPWGVASQGWDKVEIFVLPVVSGLNTLKITAANEYMCNASASNCATGADRYFGWNSTTKTFTAQIFNDPMPGDGPGVSPCFNPGGVIFAASIDYYARSETGWGSGTAFPGSNWAMYFQYPAATQ
jgi:hypothetical protein